MKILLLGLGRANLPVARYLISGHDEVFVHDDNMKDLHTDARKMIEDELLKKHAAGHYDLAITSPGFPPDHPICRELAANATPVIDEIEFVYRQLGEPQIIAVTGTNGKSTTAALISQVLDQAGISNFLGGNIAPGRPFSEVLAGERFACYVLEVSSFQLMRIERFRPHISVLTNMSIDHLNWHKDIEEYRSAKLRVFVNQRDDDFAVLNYDDDWVRGIASEIRARVLFFGFRTKTGVSINGKFHFEQDDLFPNDNLPIPGEHNLLNIAAAIAVAKIMGVDNRDIEKGIQAFRGLPHRMEELTPVKGVRYINNSMCTNATAAIASFKAIKGSKVVILGGKHKGDEGRRYFDLLVKEAKACIVLGENAPLISGHFEKHGFRNYVVATNMADAVEKARAFSEPGDIIMLNPGFASFDLFSSFLERGEAFRNAVQQD